MYTKDGKISVFYQLITLLAEENKPCQNNHKILCILALKLLRDFNTKTIQFLKSIITSETFAASHKKSPTDFTRERSLPFHITVLFLMNHLRSSLQNELDIFFKQIHKTDIPQRKVTASAFSQARHKLKHQAFQELNHEMSLHFYQQYSFKTWKSLRLVAFDGSSVKVPKSDDCRNFFGQLIPRQGSACPLARVSQCFDVLNHITLDARIESFSVGERELAIAHCNHIGRGDLILLDRGYPSFWLFSLILQKQAQFCARVYAGTWTVVKRFLASGLQEQIVELVASPPSKEKCSELNLPTTPLKVRLIRIPLEDTEEAEVLITSLVDSSEYPYELFKELYCSRWPVEEDYKLLKCRIEVENFTGKTVESVKQDFYARVFMRNLTSVLAFPLHDIIQEHYRERTLGYKINWTQALAKMRNCGIILFFRKQIPVVIDKIHRLFIQNVSVVRKGRKFSRNTRFQLKWFAFSYKPIS